MVSLDVSHRFSAKTGAELGNVRIAPSIASPVLSDLPSQHITHLCSSFFSLNSFTGRPFDGLQDVCSLLQGSPGLYHAAIALAAMDVRRQSILSHKSLEATALQYYRAAISCVQAELVDCDVGINDSVLWSTFFMGMFEVGRPGPGEACYYRITDAPQLMYDISGEGWVKHILYGTSRIVQYRGPNAHVTGVGRRFFLTVRIFEISRALIYSDETFLAQDDWRSLMNIMWSEDGAKDWHPKETLYDLMISCSLLSIHTRKMMNTIQAQSPKSQIRQAFLRKSANEGFRLQSALSNWKTSALAWSATSNKMTVDLQMMLATIYHHAITVYLSGTFDYFPHWNENDIPTPILSSSQIQTHIKAILGIVAIALKQTNLACILFLFPLRVAGARAQSLEHRFEITRMLGDVTRRGFVVADAFTIDLAELWERKALAVELPPV